MAVFGGYCSASDVEAHMQEFAFTDSSKPTLDQVETWISDIGIEINMTLEQLGYVTPVAASDEDATQWLTELNAIGVAAKAEGAASRASAPNESDHAAGLWSQYRTMLKDLRMGLTTLKAEKVSDAVVTGRDAGPLSHMNDSVLALDESDTKPSFGPDRALEQW